MFGSRTSTHDREDVLDDEPAHGDATLLRIELAAVHQSAQQHDRARHRHGQAQDEPATNAPPERDTQGDAHERGHGDLHDCTGDRDAANRQEVAEREVDPDAEHQQDHPEFGEFGRDRGIGDEPGRERADDDAREDVADDLGQPQTPSDETADERGSQADRDGGDQNGLVVHGSSRGRRGGAQDWRGSVPERRRWAP